MNNDNIVINITQIKIHLRSEKMSKKMLSLRKLLAYININ